MKKGFVAAVICQCGFALATQAVHFDITRIGQGVINPDVGAYSYTSGQTVTLTATPADGWVVDHWEGDLTGTGTSKALIMSGDKRVTVVFMPQVATPANALVRYVGQLDTNYNWFLDDYDVHFGWNKHTIRMQSQQWRSAADVERPIWDHDLGIIEPWFGDNKCALFVNGGGNDSGPPEEVNSTLAVIALVYGVT